MGNLCLYREPQALISPRGDAKKINDLLIFDAMKTLEELFLIVLLV
jgi:hypothetical protein